MVKKLFDIILTWVEFFSNMAAIITSKYPSKAPQLWAYQRTIVRVSQNFDGPSWVAYNMQFCRKAASKKSSDWEEIDLTLYNETFTGRARAKVNCRICLSDSHLERACPLPHLQVLCYLRPIIINSHHVLNRGVVRQPLIAFAKTPVPLNCVDCLTNQWATSVPTTIVSLCMYAPCVDRAHIQ